jgi:hypothetical protein
MGLKGTHKKEWFTNMVGKFIINTKTKKVIYIDNPTHAKSLHQLQGMDGNRYSDNLNQK